MDWNRDGKKDLVIGESYPSGKVRIYLNTGTDSKPEFEGGYSFLQVGGADFVAQGHENAQPEPADWNSDGKIDILVGEYFGLVNLLVNSSTQPSQPLFENKTYVKDGPANIDVGEVSSPAVADWDGDGKNDLLAGCGNGEIRYYRNQGTHQNPLFNGFALVKAGGETLKLVAYARPEVVDWDNDGGLDLVCGDSQGQVFVFLRKPDTAIPKITLKKSLISGSCLGPGTKTVTVNMLPAKVVGNVWSAEVTLVSGINLFQIVVQNDLGQETSLTITANSP